MNFDKTKTASIALILVLTLSATIIALPMVSAHDPAWTIPTFAYVSCSPSTVGVGQYTLIIMWLNQYPPTAYGTGGDRWRGFEIDITKPDGTVENIPITGDTGPVGTAWITYTPTQVGDYSIVFSWPGQVLTNGTENPDARGVPYVGDFYEPATSEPEILHVQADPITSWEEPPLPDYWTRPIPTANREWAQLASNAPGGSWLRYSDFQEWGQAPNSAHILYAKEIINGGIADELYGAVKYDTTDYENFFPSPIVMSGKIYYNAGTYPNYGYTCVDLRTGETLWHKNGTDNGLNNPYIMDDLASRGPELAQSFVQLSFGQLYHYYSINGAGIKDHLWMTQGSTWYMLDANTGNWELSLVHVPGGTSVTDQTGDLLRYSYNSRTGRFLCWNVSQSIPPGGPVGTEQQQWEPRTGATIDAVYDDSWTQYGLPPAGGPAVWYEEDILPRSGYTMNITGPTGLPSGMTVLQDENKVPKLFFLSAFSGFGFFGGSNEQTFQVAVLSIDTDGPVTPFPDKTFTQNDNLGYDVTLLWNKSFTYPNTDNRTWQLGPISYEDKVFTIFTKESRQWYGYSLEDGSLLWGPTDPQDEWDFYGHNGRYAYGTLYSGQYGGKLYAYDMKTGNLKWTYTAEGIGYESPYGDYQISWVGIADGKLYLYSSEHSPTQPMWRGSYLRCIDAYDGTEIWKQLNFVSGASIADGCIVAGNHYDNRMYVYGKGPSATTVTTAPKVIAWGDSILLEGTVTDQSAGTKQAEVTARYPNGVPAIADEYMGEWMDYLYMRQNCPKDAVGVEVVLETLDPNGNFYEIGRVTSDAAGMYKLLWEPPVPGEYTIIATFKGTDSYGSSFAETAIGVTEFPSLAQSLEPELAEPITPAPTAPAETPLITTEVAIIAVVAVACIIGVVAFWALRKRK
jgi:outer membrane protein assembly factor BamB